MITREQALTANEFHENNHCTITIGPRGAIECNARVWRRNGVTQTWKTRPTEFRIPLKYGMYSYTSIYHYHADTLHTPSDCKPRIIDNRPIEQQGICPFIHRGCNEHFTKAEYGNDNVAECHKHIQYAHAVR